MSDTQTLEHTDELEAYKGKWACLYVWAGASRVGFLTYQNAEMVRPMILKHSDGMFYPLEEALARWPDIKDKELNKRHKDLLYWQPIPVSEDA